MVRPFDRDSRAFDVVRTVEPNSTQGNLSTTEGIFYMNVCKLFAVFFIDVRSVPAVVERALAKPVENAKAAIGFGTDMPSSRNARPLLPYRTSAFPNYAAIPHNCSKLKLPTHSVEKQRVANTETDMGLRPPPPFSSFEHAALVETLLGTLLPFPLCSGSVFRV